MELTRNRIIAIIVVFFALVYGSASLNYYFMKGLTKKIEPVEESFCQKVLEKPVLYKCSFPESTCMIAVNQKNEGSAIDCVGRRS